MVGFGLHVKPSAGSRRVMKSPGGQGSELVKCKELDETSTARPRAHSLRSGKTCTQEPCIFPEDPACDSISLSMMGHTWRH